jgi:hypothetical protein
MYFGKLIFSQVMDSMPMHIFRRCAIVIRELQRKELHLSGPISLQGIFPDYIPREPARHRACLRAESHKRVNFYLTTE